MNDFLLLEIFVPLIDASMELRVGRFCTVSEFVHMLGTLLQQQENTFYKVQIQEVYVPTFNEVLGDEMPLDKCNLYNGCKLIVY